MGFQQKYVACLLGQSTTSMVSRYERGQSLPPLTVALSLGAILRVPVEFLFPKLYDELRKGIRAKEESLTMPGQQSLFSTHQ